MSFFAKFCLKYSIQSSVLISKLGRRRLGENTPSLWSTFRVTPDSSLVVMSMYRVQSALLQINTNTIIFFVTEENKTKHLRCVKALTVMNLVPIMGKAACCFENIKSALCSKIQLRKKN